MKKNVKNENQNKHTEKPTNKTLRIIRNIFTYLLMILVIYLLYLLIKPLFGETYKIINYESDNKTSTVTTPRIELVPKDSTTTKSVVTVKRPEDQTKTVTTNLPDMTQNENTNVMTYSTNEYKTTATSREVTTRKSTTKAPEYTYTATYDSSTSLYTIIVYKKGARINEKGGSLKLYSNGSMVSSSKTSKLTVFKQNIPEVVNCSNIRVNYNGQDLTVEPGKCTKQ